MRMLMNESVNPALATTAIPRPKAAAAPAATVHDSAYLLQRTQRAANDEPDSRYGAAYDYLMLERQARAMRRAHLGGLIRAAWRQWRDFSRGVVGGLAR